MNVIDAYHGILAALFTVARENVLEDPPFRDRDLTAELGKVGVHGVFQLLLHLAITREDASERHKWILCTSDRFET
jgi:hypothetical protein